jgi:hypothetical protein
MIRVRFGLRLKFPRGLFPNAGILVGRIDEDAFDEIADAVQDRMREMNAVEAEDLASEVAGLLVLIGSCVPNPRKASLGRLFGFDPFKPVRLEADRVAREYALDWKRG